MVRILPLPSHPGILAVFALVGSLAASGCFTPRSRSEALGAEAFPAQPADHPIVLFDELSDVKRPYVKVGLVYAEGRSHSSWSDMTESMKRRARELGADALVMRGEESGEESFVASTPSGPVYGKNKKHKQSAALAIRFVESEPTVTR